MFNSRTVTTCPIYIIIQSADLTSGSAPGNVQKNRYKDILPYEVSCLCNTLF